jgi:hypothetical protein
MSAMPPFHLAFPVTDIEATRAFFVDLLGCQPAREAPRWLDLDFFGHQISAHLVEQMPAIPTNQVDGKAVPASHFGAVLEWDVWHALAERLQAAQADFIIEPYLRFKGEIGEQATMFVRDPSGNGLEFKSFKDPTQLFAC